MHDCENCDMKGECALESIAPWLDEHSEELLKAKEDIIDNVTMAMATLCEVFPSAYFYQDTMASFAQQIFCIGYHKGRQFPSIPQVYQQ